jgi:hypothetical protein
VTQAHGLELRRRLVKQTDEKYPDSGVVLLYLARSFDDTPEFEDIFFPFCLPFRAELPHPLASHGTPARQYFNTVIGNLKSTAKRVKTAIDAVKNEVTARRNVTPLLLPVRNFSSDVLTSSLRRLFHELPDRSDPHALIAEIYAAFRSAHPLQAAAQNKPKCYVDHSSKAFHVPGRDLHGRLWAASGEHPETCRLNGRLRLSAPIADGFHYDALRPPVLKGEFPDCHAVISRYEGSPYLNIAPNDFIRSKVVA